MHPTKVQTNFILEFGYLTVLYQHMQDKGMENIDFPLHPPPSLARKIASEILGHLGLHLDDLVKRAPDADVLQLSHMRGHIPDMDDLMMVANTHNLKVVEDCAHTMGAKWADTWSGRYGVIGY